MACGPARVAVVDVQVAGGLAVEVGEGLGPAHVAVVHLAQQLARRLLQARSSPR